MRDYGVVIDPGTMSVDADATAGGRASRGRPFRVNDRYDAIVVG
jgi:hypothetical protein